MTGSSASASDSGFHWIISDGVVNGIGRNGNIVNGWKRSDSSDSDSVELMTPLTTPIFEFHSVIGSLTTPTTAPTLTPSLVKTSLKCDILIVTNCDIVWQMLRFITQIDNYNSSEAIETKFQTMTVLFQVRFFVFCFLITDLNYRHLLQWRYF